MTGDGANTIIISELTGALEEIVIGSKNNNKGFDDGLNQSIYLLFAKIYPVIFYFKIQQLKQNNFGIESTMNSRSLWLPCFRKSDFYFSNDLKNSNTLKDIHQLEILKENQVQEFKSIEQCLEIELKNDSCYSNSLKMSPTIDDFVIQNSFLLSIINLDVLSETNIPTVFTTVIDKSCFLSNYA